MSFLEVSLYLDDGSIKFYHKPDHKSQYNHTKTNHPLGIIKQLSVFIKIMLSNFSHNKSFFQESIIYYEGTLKKSSYLSKLVYQSFCAGHSIKENNKIIK